MLLRVTTFPIWIPHSILLITVVACSGIPGDQLDSGPPLFDSGMPLADSGLQLNDSGTTMDASVLEMDSGALDSGMPTDSGIPLADSGTPFDSGILDAAIIDSGVIFTGDAGAFVDSIKTLAVNSACYRYQWKNRGQMPRGYIKGVALSFARSVCNPTRSDILVVSKAKTTDTVNDSLAWYAAEFSALQMNNSVAGVNTLRHLYTLLLGLGMRESSGEHCVGRDMAATNTTADSAEAGAWQTSYDSRTRSMELPKLFTQYKGSTRGCFLSAYSEGVTCNAANWQNWGSATSDGFMFQKLEKECPGFAAEYAAVMLRVNGGSLGHYGPLRTKAAEIRPECDAMFQSVQGVVAMHPEVCTVL
jgi:hypothetical protein